MKKTGYIGLCFLLVGCFRSTKDINTKIKDIKTKKNTYWIGHPLEGVQYISSDGYFGLMDTSGNVLCTPKYDRIFNFYDDLAVVTRDNKYGVITKKGIEILPPKYSFISDFENGTAWIYSELSEKWGVLGRKAKLISPIELPGISKHKSLGMVFNGRDLMNQDGEVIFKLIPSDFTGTIGERNDLLSAKNQVRHSRGVAYLTNLRNWNEARTPFYENVPSDLLFYFQEGLALFPKNVNGTVKLGYMNERGEEIISPKYENAQHFTNQHACVKLNGKWGLINQDNQFVIEPKYDYLETASSKYFIFKKNNSYGIINHAENVIIRGEFLKIEYLFDDVFALLESTPKIRNQMEEFNKQTPNVKIDKWGAINIASGDTILPFSFHIVQQINDGFGAGINFSFVEFQDSKTAFNSDEMNMLPPRIINGKGILTIFNDKIITGKYETDYYPYFDVEIGTTKHIYSIIPYYIVDRNYKIGDSFLTEQGIKITDESLREILIKKSNQSKIEIFQDGNLKGCRNQKKQIILAANYNELNIVNSGIIGRLENEQIFFDFLGKPLVRLKCDKMEETHTGILKITKGTNVFLINKLGERIN